MLDAIGRNGSFAAAARELGKVPSALTYNVRQLEARLDVLLFDRSSREARLTAAGVELLAEGRRLFAEMEAVANRIHRVAAGWEKSLTIAANAVVSTRTILELCQSFYALRSSTLRSDSGPGTQLRVRTEAMAGTVEALLSGHADIAIGVPADTIPRAGIELRHLGSAPFVFVVAAGHPLAGVPEPLATATLRRHRSIAVADSARSLPPMTVYLQDGQDVLTVSDVHAKLNALLMGLGAGFMPEVMVRMDVAAGRLIIKQVQEQPGDVPFAYAWRSSRATAPRGAGRGLALRWWLQQLDSPSTRAALLQ